MAAPEDRRHSNKMDSTGANNYASNPGYIDDGDDSVFSRYQENSNSGMVYYRDVGRPTGGSCPNKDSYNSFHIQRPMVGLQTDNNLPYDNNR